MPEDTVVSDPQVYLAYGTFFFKTHHSFIRRLRRYYEASTYGTRAWPASFLLIDYLQHHAPTVGEHVVEIGCGWAAAGVHTAVHWHTNVTGVDVDENVFPYMHMLASLNDVKLQQLHKKIEDLDDDDLRSADLIIGSDICFWDELVQPIFDMINRGFANRVKRVVLADPGRAPFYELADLCAETWEAELLSWYAVEPSKFAGEILVVQPRPSS